MRIRRHLPICLALLALATPAGAQDNGKTGLTMGYPASIGIIWQASDKVAIRPELSFSGGSGKVSGSSFVTDSDSWTVATGVSALFYLHTYDHLRTYFSPRFTYSHISATTNASGFTNSSTTTKGNGTSVAGSFGAQYALGDKFSVFGEVGFGFGHSTTKSGITSAKASGNSWATRTGVGVIFYP